MQPEPAFAHIATWYREHARTIAWRTPSTSAWGVLLSEVMSQQTQVSRVEPVWIEWMARWPTPRDFAQASPAEVLRAWGRLGYPRRALRLHECAKVIVERHGNVVPSSVDELLALPGIGDYTARAVAAFAYGQRVPVIDTNVRRVLARLLHGRFLAGSASKKELVDLEQRLPEQDAPLVSVALMELGALVCLPKPDCQRCPVRRQCRWQELGKPMPSEEELATKKRRRQAFHGTDRYVRGLIMQALREAPGPVPKQQIDVLWADAAQRSRALFSLLDDGLAEQTAEGCFQLPG